MNPYLDDDLVALADQARRFAADRIAPGFQERNRTRVPDRGLMKAMGEMGFIAPESAVLTHRPSAESSPPSKTIPMRASFQFGCNGFFYDR